MPDYKLIPPTLISSSRPGCGPSDWIGVSATARRMRFGSKASPVSTLFARASLLSISEAGEFIEIAG
jgi:hypothetical protein